MLATKLNAGVQTAGDSHIVLTIGGSSLRIEFHTEFTEYTFTKNTIGDFESEPILDTVPADWIEGIPGETVNRVQIHVEPVVESSEPADSARSFGIDKIHGSDISDRQMRVWSDFRVAAQGNTRILLECKTDDPARIGRAVQRVIDIENYRMMAFIGLQKSREISPPMTDIEKKLETVMQNIANIESVDDEKQTLAELTDLSAQVELLKARSMNRFRATEAYSEIMQDRLGELREAKIEGCLSFGGFLLRRSIPAFRTCRAAKERILDLSLRVSRAAELLRTRIDVQLEEQNQQLLQSVDNRASLQNRLQLTIEWFSVFAISVYLLQLAKFILDAIVSYGYSLNVPLILGVSAPIVLVAVALVINVIRRRYND